MNGNGCLMSNTYPLCAYYVRSPSTSSRSATAQTPLNPDESLSCCSSTASCFPDEADGTRHSRLGLVDEGDDRFGYGRSKRGGWLSFRRYESCLWIGLQMTWRLLLSLGVALLVFYLATKPPPPKMSIQVGRILMFRLSEGVDGHGVPTKSLTCNCSMDLMIENKSKFFGLHVHPPTIDMSFSRLHFAVSQGPKLYADSHGATLFKLSVGTKNRPVYGAGRNMQDMLTSRHGLPLVVRARFSSHFRVVWDLIKPQFCHLAECSLFLTYDKTRRVARAHRSSCNILS